MKINALSIAAIAFGLAACGEQAPPATQQAEPPDTAPEATMAPSPAETAVDQEFIDHMHAHAEQLDELMFALADGDLAGAMTPAYWLSRHRTVSGVPDEWQQFITGMREAALAVESATDLDTARAAAEQITTHCQGCHAAAGVAGIEESAN
jgi:mono/diheme cytochrome c family protein